MKEFIEELKHNQKVNYEKGLGNRIEISYVIERLEEIENKHNEYFEVCKSGIISAIEDLCNDELYSEYQEKIENIEQDDINTLSWKLYDYADFSEIYQDARDEVVEMVSNKD